MSIRIDVPLTLPNGFVTEELLASNFQLPTSKIERRSFATHKIPLHSVRTPAGAVIPNTNTVSDAFLNYTPGTLGTNTPRLRTADLKIDTETQSCRFSFVLPANYVSGGSARIVIRSNVDAVADTTQTLDVIAYLYDGDGAIDGTDLVQTAVQALTGSAADYTFELDSSSLEPGSQVDVQINIAISDAAGASPVIGNIYEIDFQAHTRG